MKNHVKSCKQIESRIKKRFLEDTEMEEDEEVEFGYSEQILENQEKSYNLHKQARAPTG